MHIATLCAYVHKNKMLNITNLTYSNGGTSNKKSHLNFTFYLLSQPLKEVNMSHCAVPQGSRKPKTSSSFS